MSKEDTLGVTVEPRIGIDVDVTGLDDAWASPDCQKILETAIATVRNMDAEELKKLVIEGLVDADMYPHDFASY